MADDEPLLDIKQAAALLQVTETSLRRWTDAGRLACLRIGSRRERRFRRADLLAFLENQPATHAGPERTTKSTVSGTVIGGLPVQHGSHLCSLYTSPASRTKLAVGFLADGLSEGSACYLVCTAEASAPFLEQLEQRRSTIAPELRAELQIVSEEFTGDSEQLESLEARFVAALRRGAQSLRVVDNVSEGAFSKTRRFSDVLQHEENYERLLARRFPVVSLCQYDARQHSCLEVCEILRCHPDVFRYPVERLLL